MNSSRLRHLPNTISVFRLVLVPIFAILYFSDFESGRLLAGLVFLLAAISDITDGYIARRFDLVSALGHILDPLADKCMQCTAAICLSSDGIIPPWIVVILICKEVLLMFGSSILFRRYTDCIPANFFGKAASFLIFTLIAFYVLFPDIFREGALWLFLAAAVMSLVSFTVYTVRGIRILRTDALPSEQSVRRSAAPHNDSEVN